MPPIVFISRWQQQFQFLRPLLQIRAFAVIACSALYLYGQMNAQITPSAKENLSLLHPSAKVKIVFICQDTMRYVDFSESAQQIHTLNNVASAYFPVISSDGNWVTYQTDIEAEGPSANAQPGIIWCRQLTVDATPIKVSDTGYVPRFVQNTPSDSPEIIYSTSLACPINICYNDGRTVKKKLINGSPQSAKVVYANGSYYGGLSWDGRFLVTGWPAGPNAFMLDLQDTFKIPHPVHTMRVKKISPMPIPSSPSGPAISRVPPALFLPIRCSFMISPLKQ